MPRNCQFGAPFARGRRPAQILCLTPPISTGFFARWAGRMAGMKTTRRRPWFLATGTIVGAILGGMFSPEYSYACVAAWILGSAGVGLYIGLVLAAIFR